MRVKKDNNRGEKGETRETHDTKKANDDLSNFDDSCSSFTFFKKAIKHITTRQYSRFRSEVRADSQTA